eukprot:137562-Rhodomonas_salina.1
MPLPGGEKDSENPGVTCYSLGRVLTYYALVPGTDTGYLLRARYAVSGTYAGFSLVPGGKAGTYLGLRLVPGVTTGGPPYESLGPLPTYCV